MSESFDFEDNFTQSVTGTQRIDEGSSDEDRGDGNKFSLLKPTQAIQTDSGEDENNEESEEIAGFSGGISPVFESNRTRSPSPVFPSQSLLATKKSAKRSLWKARAAVEDSSSDDMFGPTQNIESDPSTQSPNLMTKYLSGDSTKIDSPGSFQSVDELAAIANLDTFHTLLQNNRSDKKIKRPTKGGIVEKFDLAMKKSASDRVLNQHLPSKLRRPKPEKKTVQVLKITSDWSLVILRCLDYQLDPQNGKREEFDLIVDQPVDLQRCKLTEKCDITIEGPWLSFFDQEGTKVTSNVFKFDVINKQNHPSEKRKLFNEEKVFYQAKK